MKDDLPPNIFTTMFIIFITIEPVSRPSGFGEKSSKFQPLDLDPPPPPVPKVSWVSRTILLHVVAVQQWTFGNEFIVICHDKIHQKLNGTESQRTPDQVSCETELLDTHVFLGSVQWVLLEISWTKIKKWDSFFGGWGI